MRVWRSAKKPLRVAVLALCLIPLTGAAPASALVINPAPSAKVSFTFDDSLQSAYTQAAPALAAYGLTGTDYVITGCVGMTTTPNTCAANPDAKYMTWDQVSQLKSTYGWEIGGHTVSHPQLATDNLTDAQLTQEVAGSKQALIDHGFSPTAFATPYGDYDNRVLAEIAKSYSSHRGFADVDNNVWPGNDYLLNDMQVQAGVTVAQVEARVDEAIANNHWLVLTFHDIKTNPSNNPDDYEYSTANLSAIAAYVKAKQDAGQLKTVNVSQGLTTSDSSLLTNGGFSGGIANGWATDTPANVTADSGNHGSYPEPQHAVAITTGASNVHLFSPKVGVSSSDTYMLKSFLNLTARSSGELGYYVDEYDASGNWVSGKWIGAKTTPTVEEVSFTYTPSSATVKKASLQVYSTGGSGITAYVDQFQWFSLTGATTPPPTNTINLLPNSTFDHGIADGWTTDNSSVFSTDSGNHGSNSDPTNALKITGGATQAHLFAPRVNVSDTNVYTVNAYLALAAIQNNGEVAFYIDEYNTAGNWVSGQYAYAKRTADSTPVSFSYTPSSSSVAQAGLQVIATANSGLSGYLDSVEFLAPAGATPTPAPTNLVANGTFDNGIANGWTTNDPTNIVVDSGNHGSPNNPVNAVLLTASSQNRHLFSPQVTVDSTKLYSIASYLNITQITSGEVGFYIDEYDTAGNWVSGQYKTGVSTLSSSDVLLQYAPTSVNVAKAALQVILTGNSGIKAYFDDVRWIQN